jgi:hypothetical protein
LVLFGGLTFLMFTADVGSVSRFASARRVQAKVTSILGEASNKIYQVEVDDPLPAIRGGSFTRYCGLPQRATCLVFDSRLRTLRPTDRTEVLFLPDGGEAFLSGEEWENKDLNTAAVNVGVWLALGVFLAWAVEDLIRNQRARAG